MTQRMLTSQQTATVLRVHRSTVHRWVLRGLLEPAQVITIPAAPDGEPNDLPDDMADRKIYLFDAAYIAQLAARQRSA